MREICTSGSVRGAARKGRPYRDQAYLNQKGRGLTYACITPMVTRRGRRAISGPRNSRGGPSALFH